MPEFAYTPQPYSDPSTLMDGSHPALLLAITDEDIPAGWKMGEKAKRMWRWHFAIWDHPGGVGQVYPEYQTAVSSQTFSAGGRNGPSKSFAWCTALIGRTIAPGERINIDAMLPLPCSVFIVHRLDQAGQRTPFITVKELSSWQEGLRYITDDLKNQLRPWFASKTAQNGGGQPPAAPQPAPVPTTPPYPGPAAQGAAQTPPPQYPTQPPAAPPVAPQPPPQSPPAAPANEQWPVPTAPQPGATPPQTPPAKPGW